MPESYDKNVSVFTFRKIIGAVNETRIRDARFSIFPPVLLPPTSNQHSFSGTSRPTCDVRIKFVKSVCGLIPVPGGCRAKKTSTEGEDASRRSRRLREQRRVRVVPRAPVLQNEVLSLARTRRRLRPRLYPNRFPDFPNLGCSACS